MSIRDVIVGIWSGEAKTARWLLYVPLACLSYLYQISVMAKEFMYKTGIMKTQDSPIPVISVGNITLGGTGKTPVVERLSRTFKDRGFNPGIITRGYLRTKSGTFPVDVKNDSAETAGDEAYMLAKRTRIPVIVGKDRLTAIECGVDCCNIDLAILDDGFQVKDVRKDADILILNGKESLARQELFPLGPYRDPVSRVRECDAILVSKAEPDSATIAFTRGIPRFQVRHHPVHLYNMKQDIITHYDYVKNKRIAAFSGLGDNESFFQLLRQLGANVVHETSYPDHYRYTQRDIKKLESVSDIECIVTTEKDAVKLLGMELPDNLFYLSIEARIEDEDTLMELLLKKTTTRPPVRLA
ncbi:MAG: tetraacyldisaccharide 4'-kinase [Syntrophorhabdaceae bacterium]|nr:tetraacyldisaccharide 4'-kinase [Syntrophorhabdaceae bacterium]